MTEAEIYWNQVPAVTDEIEALTPDPPIEFALEPISRRLLFAALDSGPGTIIRVPDIDSIIETPVREYSSSKSIAASMGEASDEMILDEGFGEEEEEVVNHSVVSRFSRCKARDGGCNGPADYIPQGGSYFECLGVGCETARLEPGDCDSCGETMSRVWVERGTIICRDTACSKISQDTGSGSGDIPPAAPMKASSAAAESKVAPSWEKNEVEQHIDAMLASKKWGARMQILLFITAGGDDSTRLTTTAPWMHGEAARHANAKRLKPPAKSVWSARNVKQGVGDVARELLKRLELDDTTAYREMAAKFRRNGSQMLLEALADRLASNKRLRPVGVELGLVR